MLKLLGILSITLLLPLTVKAEQLTVTLHDVEGQPVRNSVIVLTPTEGLPPAEPTTPFEANMDQVNKQFVPHVLAVQTNTRVHFPNSDSIKHHVYSFSPAKSFEIRLYKALDADPILFDQAGVVDIGCNIHDWMLGYIYITDSPYFAKTDAQGQAQIQAPNTLYTLTLWHPRLAPNSVPPSMTVNMNTDQTITLELTDALLPSFDYGEGFEDY